MKFVASIPLKNIEPKHVELSGGVASYAITIESADPQLIMRQLEQILQNITAEMGTLRAALGPIVEP